MEQKLDLRIQKTYLALSGALLEAMGEKPFEDIRVNELCDRAMVRKSTFYKHFGDKYELLAFVVRQGLRRFDAQIGEGSTADMDPVDSYGRIIDCLFDYLRGNEHLIRSVSGSGCFPLVLDILSEQIVRDIQDKLREDCRKGHKMPASPEVMAPFFVGAVTECVKRWMAGGRKMGKGDLKGQIGGLLRAVYYAAN
ncbi:MAG: TetR/AcrR family transcriptional regulator [Oscillospiraceae bacterium]|jgi:AcrR family transcriptional regulator|nr:TetR/AcrR family transcriptional regulator [Oscillospiraceae bacterium]